VYNAPFLKTEPSDRPEPIRQRGGRSAGVVQTKDGSTQYRAGDYLMSNADDDSDRYAISAEKFAALYLPADEDDSW
jgi:hypothetical protein